jgi:cation transport ATPase
MTKFTLVRMGVLASWLFSLASVAFFPMLGRHTIEPVPVFFDSAALVTLLALRVQMLEAKTVRATPANRASVPALYEPLVIGAAVLTFALWLCLGTNPSLMQAPEKAAARALASAVAVLIAASPCALGLATSMSSREGVKHNVLFAFIYGAAIIPIAAGLLYPFFGIRFNPMLAGVAMILSSLFVVLNARRLRRA